MNSDILLRKLLAVADELECLVIVMRASKHRESYMESTIDAATTDLKDATVAVYKAYHKTEEMKRR